MKPASVVTSHNLTHSSCNLTCDTNIYLSAQNRPIPLLVQFAGHRLHRHPIFRPQRCGGHHLAVSACIPYPLLSSATMAGRDRASWSDEATIALINMAGAFACLHCQLYATACLPQPTISSLHLYRVVYRRWQLGHSPECHYHSSRPVLGVGQEPDGCRGDLCDRRSLCHEGK